MKFKSIIKKLMKDKEKNIESVYVDCGLYIPYKNDYNNLELFPYDDVKTYNYISYIWHEDLDFFSWRINRDWFVNIDDKDANATYIDNLIKYHYDNYFRIRIYLNVDDLRNSNFGGNINLFIGGIKEKNNVVNKKFLNEYFLKKCMVKLLCSRNWKIKYKEKHYMEKYDKNQLIWNSILFINVLNFIVSLYNMYNIFK